MNIEKGKTSNGYAQNRFKIALTLDGGGYLTFIVSTNVKIIKKKTNLMYLIATTPFREWHNRPADVCHHCRF